MIFENIALNAVVIVLLIVALSLDYLTKFFNYWYVRFIPYKTPVPVFGSDYARVLGVADSADVASQLYFNHPKDKYVGYIKSRIPELIVRDPDVIKLILVDSFNHFRNRGLCLEKSADYSLKNSAFFAENELWMALRHRLLPFFDSQTFSAETLKNAPSILSLPTAAVESDICELANAVSSALLYEFLFQNNELTADEVEVISTIKQRLRKNSLISRIKNYTMSIFPSLYVLFNMTRLEKSLVQRLLKMIHGMTQKPVPTGTFIKFLQKISENGPIELTDDEEQRNRKKRYLNIDDEVIACQVVALVNEGFIPCCNTVAAALFELARAEDVQLRVQQELDQLPSGTAVPGDASYLGRVVDEVLRLHPSYSLLNRVCVAPYKIPNTSIVIDKGVTVAIPVAAIHKDSAYYENPDKFDPDRFHPTQVQKRHPYTFIPFGAGPRCCIAEPLARRWIRACLSSVLRGHVVTSCARTPRRLPLTPGAFSSTVQPHVWLTIEPRRNNS